jgi:hypothetical protein
MVLQVVASHRMGVDDWMALLLGHLVFDARRIASLVLRLSLVLCLVWGHVMQIWAGWTISDTTSCVGCAQVIIGSWLPVVFRMTAVCHCFKEEFAVVFSGCTNVEKLFLAGLRILPLRPIGDGKRL